MHEVLVNRLGGLSLPRKSVVRLTDCPDMTLDVYRGRKTTMQQQQQYCTQLVCSHFLRISRVYEPFWDKSAEQSMAEPCLLISDLMFGEIRQKSHFIQTDLVK